MQPFKFRARKILPATNPAVPNGTWSEWQTSKGGGLYAVAFQRAVTLMEAFGSTEIILNGRNMEGEWVEWQIRLED